MKKAPRILALALLLVYVCGVLAGCSPASSTTTTSAVTTTAAASSTQPVTTAEVVTPGGTLPRNETLYFGGMQFGSVVGWNPYSSSMNNALYSAGLVWEMLYMYNMLDGSMVPALADGDYIWNSDRTQITVKLNPDAYFSDGSPVTAEDVVYSFDTGVKYSTTVGLNYSPYIEKVEAIDTHTVVFYAALGADGKPVNVLKMEEYLGGSYVVPKAYTQKLEERTGEDAAAFTADTCEDFVASGAYKSFYVDSLKVVLIRDDNYWGQAASMWGKLPVPKYLCHAIYTDNAASLAAFKAGEVDVAQQFIPNVEDLWLKENLPVATYIEEAPYGIAATLPTAFYNLKSYGLDNVAVRKAIAIAVDYDAIISNALTNQSPTFKQVPRSLMNPTAGEQATYDQAAVADLQWTGNDIDGANAMLDEAGIVDTDGDGYRELDGKKLSYVASCPNGWTDWQAAIEIVAAAGKKIGIEITTYYPTYDVYLTITTNPNQTDCDIFMSNTAGSLVSQPWSRIRQLLSSEFVSLPVNYLGNFGGYSNPEIDEIIAAIPGESDSAKLKALYTRAVEIYLTDVPSFTLMYRPSQFYAVNESVWTNYPEYNDGRNIPPTCLALYYGIAGLYDLELMNP